MAAAEPGRYEIKNNEWETKLRVHNLTEADRGLYYCGAVYAIGTSMGQVKLKVSVSVDYYMRCYAGSLAQLVAHSGITQWFGLYFQQTKKMCFN